MNNETRTEKVHQVQQLAVLSWVAISSWRWVKGEYYDALQAQAYSYTQYYMDLKTPYDVSLFIG